MRIKLSGDLGGIVMTILFACALTGLLVWLLDMI